MAWAWSEEACIVLQPQDCTHSSRLPGHYTSRKFSPVSRSNSTENQLFCWFSPTANNFRQFRLPVFHCRWRLEGLKCVLKMSPSYAVIAFHHVICTKRSVNVLTTRRRSILVQACLLINIIDFLPRSSFIKKITYALVVFLVSKRREYPTHNLHSNLLF